MAREVRLRQNPAAAMRLDRGFRAKIGLSNEGLIRAMMLDGSLMSERVMDAFRHVDRGIFAPSDKTLAYAQMPLRHGNIHLSTPSIYAEAAELMMPIAPGMSFLNIGSGTGYFSSIIAHLQYSDPDISTNHGIELFPDTLAYAREKVAQIPHAANVEFFAGNVFNVDTRNSMRYDRVYIGSCASPKLKGLYELLEIGGIMVGPFQTCTGAQQLRRITRVSRHEFHTEIIRGVSFANLVRPSRHTPVILPEKSWTMQHHSAYTPQFRRAIKTTLLAVQCSRRPVPPMEIWINHVFPACSRHWFEASPSSKANAGTECSPAKVPSPRQRVCGLFNGSDASPSRSSHSSAVGPGCGVSIGSPCTEQDDASMAASEDHVEVFDDGRRHRIGMEDDPDDLTHRGVVSLDLRDFLALVTRERDQGARREPSGEALEGVR